MKKAYNQYITEDFLKSRENVDKPVQKWILFCRYFMSKGYKIRLYEARRTVSKYITLIKDGKSCKVRFSNHRPIREREKNKDCDFFVGVTNFQVITAHDVAKPDLQHLQAKNDKIELLKSALKYSNSTAQLALILIRSIDSLNKSAIARDLEEMITKIKIVLNDESEE